jgi:AraC-like DNA-binding protein
MRRHLSAPGRGCVMETLGLRPGPAPAGAGTASEYQTSELVSRVREARLQASGTRQESGKVLAIVSGTTVNVCRTRRQAARTLEQRRQAARSAAAGGRVTRPRAAEAADPVSAPAGPPGAERQETPPATLRRAVAFIDEHAHQDISAADIAAASYVSVRAIQLAFQRHLGVTPTEYLRRVRLERAHHDLVAADPARDSVTGVAYRWGFGSASRFASYYRSAYGVLPAARCVASPVSSALAWFKAASREASPYPADVAADRHRLPLSLPGEAAPVLGPVLWNYSERARLTLRGTSREG